ncbi:MAG: hypothetical protein AB7E37_06665 [Candidatus Altimarinota bacterium]
MNAQITVYNQVGKEKLFKLPMNEKEIAKFTNNYKLDYEITDIEDEYNFLASINAENSNLDDINKLVALIEDIENKKEVITKLLYHYKNYNTSIDTLLEKFEDILNKYETYSNFRNEEEWAEAYNNVYTFVNLENPSEIASNFDYELKDTFLRDLRITIDIGDLENRIYDMSIEEILEEIEKMGLLSNFPFSIAFYLDWKSKLKELRANGINIDKLNEFIIVEK